MFESKRLQLDINKVIKNRVAYIKMFNRLMIDIATLTRSFVLLLNYLTIIPKDCIDGTDHIGLMHIM